MKEEYADPRAYAMIYITIENNGATFKLDSYVEILEKNLVVLSSDAKQIILRDKDNENSKFIIRKTTTGYKLTSDLLDETTGENVIYELEKEL